MSSAFRFMTFVMVTDNLRFLKIKYIFNINIQINSLPYDLIFNHV